MLNDYIAANEGAALGYVVKGSKGIYQWDGYYSFNGLFNGGVRKCSRGFIQNSVLSGVYGNDEKPYDPHVSNCGGNDTCKITFNNLVQVAPISQTRPVTHYRVWRSNGFNNNANRAEVELKTAPLAWRLYGVRDNKSVLLSEGTVPQNYWREEGAKEYFECTNVASSVGCTAFYFVPTETEITRLYPNYAQTDLKSAIEELHSEFVSSCSYGWNVGIEEIEIFFDDGTGQPITTSVYDPRFADTVDVSGLNASNLATEGATITLTPTMTKTVFRSWKGLPEGAVVDTETGVATFTMGKRPLDVELCTSPKWIYLPDEPCFTLAIDGTKTVIDNKFGVISNDVFIINVGIAKAADKELRVGLGDTNTSPLNGHALANRVGGILDLSGPIETIGGEKWTITRVGQQAMMNVSRISKLLTHLIMPETMSTYVGANFVRQDTSRDPGESALEKIVFNAPNLTARIQKQFAMGTALAELELNVPKLIDIDEEAFDTADKNGVANMKKTNYSAWRLDSLKTIGTNGLVGATRLVDQTLALPKILTIYENGLHLEGLNELSLGGGYALNADAVLTLENIAISGNADLRKIFFGPYASYDIASDAFAGDAGIAEIFFDGRCVTGASGVLEAVLNARGENDVSPVVYASQFMGWSSIGVSQLTGDEESERTQRGLKRVFGVYRAANGKKAWLCHRESPLMQDPKGTILIIR